MMRTRPMTRFLVPLLYVALTAAVVQSAIRLGDGPGVKCQAVPHSPQRQANAAAYAAALVRPPFFKVVA